MKRLLLLLLLAPLCPLAGLAGEAANTILIHPNEVIYVRYQQNGIKLKLVSSGQAKDEQAQIILTMAPTVPAGKVPSQTLKVENRFPLDFHYKAQMRSLTLKLRMMCQTYPVVAGKISLVEMIPGMEEVAIYGGVLEK
jgi:hypothetical protein